MTVSTSCKSSNDCSWLCSVFNERSSGDSCCGTAITAAHGRAEQQASVQQPRKITKWRCQPHLQRNLHFEASFRCPPSVQPHEVQDVVDLAFDAIDRVWQERVLCGRHQRVANQPQRLRAVSRKHLPGYQDASVELGRQGQRGTPNTKRTKQWAKNLGAARSTANATPRTTSGDDCIVLPDTGWQDSWAAENTTDHNTNGLYQEIARGRPAVAAMLRCCGDSGCFHGFLDSNNQRVHTVLDGSKVMHVQHAQQCGGTVHRRVCNRHSTNPSRQTHIEFNKNRSEAGEELADAH